jgi:hypothetical protein
MTGLYVVLLLSHHSVCSVYPLQILNLGPTEEGDPVLSCPFKTEFTTHLMKLTQTGVNLIIAPTYDPFTLLL